MKKHLFTGFTLLELLIILVIVGLIVQVAVPQYQTFTQKAQSRKMLADLLSLQAEVESCYFSTMDYRPCVEPLKPPLVWALDKAAERFTYQLTLTADDHGMCEQMETNHEHVTTHEIC